MKDLPPLQWLRSFESAARHLSFTHAAAELKITQSAISQQVKLLENYLGHPLFIRRPRSLDLTQTGYSYLPDVQSALSILRASTRAYIANKNDDAVMLRCNMAFSVMWLTPRLHRFLALHPNISVHIVPAVWEADYKSEHNGIEVRFGTDNWPHKKVALLENNVCYPVCSQQMAETISNYSDIVKHPLIHIIGNLEEWDDYFEAVGLKPIRSTINHATPTSAISLEMVKNNLGITLAHDVVCHDMLSRKEIVKPFSFELPMKENYYLVYDDADLTENESLFCDWLIKEIAEWSTSIQTIA